MSDSTHRPMSSRWAACNPYSQIAVNKSLANFLANNNYTVPASLKHLAQGEDCRSHSKQWLMEVHGNLPEVCSHLLVFKTFHCHLKAGWHWWNCLSWLASAISRPWCIWSPKPASLSTRGTRRESYRPQMFLWWYWSSTEISDWWTEEDGPVHRRSTRCYPRTEQHASGWYRSSLRCSFASQWWSAIRMIRSSCSTK